MLTRPRAASPAESPLPFALLWAAVLAAGLVAGPALALLERPAARRALDRAPTALVAAALAIAVGALGGLGLHASLSARPPALAVERIVVGAIDRPLVVGGARDAGVVLGDPWVDREHAHLLPGPSIQPLSARRRVEVDGIDSSAVVLGPGSVLGANGARWRVDATGAFLPWIEVGGTRRWGNPLQWAVASLPVVGRGREVPLALLVEARSPTMTAPDADPEGRVARIAWRDGRVTVRYPTPSDRWGGALDADGKPIALRAAPFGDGSVLGLGYTRYRVEREKENGSWSLVPDRAAWVRPEEWDARISAVQEEETGALRLDAMEPDFGFAQEEQEGALVRAGPGLPSPRAHLAPGGRVAVRDAEGRGTDLRWTAAWAPGPGWRTDGPSGPLWKGYAAWALGHVLVSAALALAGVLHRRNLLVLHASATLAAAGVVTQAELVTAGGASGEPAAKQAAFLLVGWAGVLAWPLVDGGRLLEFLAPARRAWVLVAVASALLLVQIPFGERGISGPGLSLQPVEAVKVLVLVFLAMTVQGRRRAAPYFAVGVLALLAMLLHDLSPIVVFAALAGFVGLHATGDSAMSGRRLAVGFCVAAVLGGAAAALGIASSETAAARFAAWASPWTATSGGEQLVRGLWAMADGRIFGSGIGAAAGGLPPEVDDDFILAFVVERLGWMGLVVLLANLGLLVGATWRAAGAASGPCRLLVRGAAVLFLVQAGINVGSATGVLPVMGQPLPFLSAGGSHVVAMCAPLIAIVLSATRVPAATRSHRDSAHVARFSAAA